jgi:hypothetical protein
VAHHARHLAAHWERQFWYWDSVAQQVEAVELVRVQAERAAYPRAVGGMVTPEWYDLWASLRTHAEWYDLWASLRTHAEHRMAIARRDAARVKSDHYAALVTADIAIRGEVGGW